MVFRTIKSSIKDHRIILFVCLVFLSSIIQVTAATRRAVNCRKYVHAPECRGIAAKRDTSGHLSDDYRYPQEESELLEAEKSILNNQFLNSRTLLGEFLRKLLSEKPAEYDTGTGNYIFKK